MNHTLYFHGYPKRKKKNQPKTIKTSINDKHVDLIDLLPKTKLNTMLNFYCGKRNERE